LTQVFRKEIKTGSPLVCDLDFSERALLAVQQKSWRAILNPVPVDGKFIHKKDGVFNYYTKTIAGAENLWAVRLSTYSNHLEALWRSTLDLKDATENLDIQSVSHGERHLSLLNFALSQFQSGSINVCVRCKKKAIDILEMDSSIGLRGETLLHGDFHPGNVIISNKLFVVIDLDNLSPGPIFGDILYSSIWGMNIEESYFEMLQRFEEKLGRGIKTNDVAWALAVMTRQAIGNSGGVRRRIELGIHWLLHGSLIQS
jgi:thiamine kinase-like enzyme